MRLIDRSLWLIFEDSDQWRLVMLCAGSGAAQLALSLLSTPYWRHAKSPEEKADVSNDPALAAGDTAFIEFVRTCEELNNEIQDPLELRDAVADKAAELARRWMIPDPDFRRLQPGAPYSSYQLYLNDDESLSIVIDIFAPGQVAPIHNHCCWGVFVCLEGEELERRYAVADDLSGRPVETEILRNGPGIASVGAPERNAFHQVECVGDVAATSLHIYGANIKALERDRWDEESKQFVSFRSGADPRRRQVRHYLTPAGLRAR